MSNSQWIESVIAETLKSNGFNEDYIFKSHGDQAKGDHYGSDLAFVDVFQKNNEEKPVFNLLLKYMPLSPTLKEMLPGAAKLFRTEICVYTRIIPRYNQMLKEKSQPPLDFTAKCFYTRETENDEVVVLENLKPYGFIIHPKETYMNRAHITMLLKKLAQWHALSFVHKDKYYDEFQKLTEANKNSPWRGIINSHMGAAIEYGYKALYKLLEETGETEVLNNFKAKFKNSDCTRMMQLLLSEDQNEKNAILIHGDCWNNNFIFQYKGQDHSEPTQICFLDFQVCSLRSPVIDVAQFIFTTAASEELKNLKEILLFYYNELARNIKTLGSEPEKLFSLEDFKQQWHKYSAHGVIVGLLAPIFLHMDVAPMELPDEKDMMKMLPIQVTKPHYTTRVASIARCFAMFEF